MNITANRTSLPLSKLRRYLLDDQVGFVLRQAFQRHTTLFTEKMGAEITPTQWAVISKLHEIGACSQNLLGRQTAMDAATVKGVVDRLTKRGIVATAPDPNDGRRILVSLTEEGENLADLHIGRALDVTEATLAPLTATERGTLMSLLMKLR